MPGDLEAVFHIRRDDRAVDIEPPFGTLLRERRGIADQEVRQRIPCEVAAERPLPVAESRHVLALRVEHDVDAALDEVLAAQIAEVIRERVVQIGGVRQGPGGRDAFRRIALRRG